MAKETPSVPKGTRDFLPVEIARRNYIFDIIRDVYQLYGFKPIETPAMENLSTLMGKYGEEGDRLIFKILNSGDFLSKVPDDFFQNKQTLKIANRICEKALRYDLTVPFARYVVQHQHQLSFPFRRYQIQPVWRADRPQKGRYREFYQCDGDIIGSDVMMNELELINIVDEVFSKLGLNVLIKINNRKILAGIAKKIGYADKFNQLTNIIDKLEKIGIEKVIEELQQIGIDQKGIDNLQSVLHFDVKHSNKIDHLKKMLDGSEIGMKGINELEELFEMIEQVKTNCDVELDISLARGLNYYTSTIIEVKSKDVNIGSVCGGGRYDDLTGIFGMKEMSGVGVSFGAERIYDIMKEKDLFPKQTTTFTQLLIVNFEKQQQNYYLTMAKDVRNQGIKCEVFPEPAKLKKQMQYADKNNIPFVLIVGEEEIQKGQPTLKNMNTGEQFPVDIKHISEWVPEHM